MIYRYCLLICWLFIPLTVFFWRAEAFFFFLMSALVAYGSSWARDQIWVTALTYAAAQATLDPLAHCTGQGSNPLLCSHPRCCSQILNPLCHSGNSQKCLILIVLMYTLKKKKSALWLMLYLRILCLTQGCRDFLLLSSRSVSVLDVLWVCPSFSFCK